MIDDSNAQESSGERFSRIADESNAMIIVYDIRS